MGNFNGRQFSAKLGYNQPILAGNFSLVPTAFIHHSFTIQDAYNETNAATVGLQVDKQSANSFEVGVGASLSYDATTARGGVVPSLEVQFRQDLVGDRLESTNTFIGGGIPFNLRGASVARTSADIGTGFKVIVRENLNVLANYSLALKSTYHAHVGSFTVRYAF
jgi:outer membrane autotransporter protein